MRLPIDAEMSSAHANTPEKDCDELVDDKLVGRESIFKKVKQKEMYDRKHT